MNEIDIKNLLDKFREDKKVITKLRSSFDFDSILNVAFKNKMYDLIIDLITPIEIDGEIKIYFDIFTYLSPIDKNLPTFINRFNVSKDEKENILCSIYSVDIEVIRKIKIGNTLPRQIVGWGHPINSINDVIYYSEPACLESMIYLFTNNIKTTMNDTQCVYGDVEEKGDCVIWIDYDSLSEENKNVANDLISIGVADFVREKKPNTIAIHVPCTRNETVGDVSDRLKKIITNFVKQPILYGIYSKELMLKQIKDYIRNGIYYNFYLPNGLDSFCDYCIKLIENGLVMENPNGNLQTEDGQLFLIDDFVNVILNSSNFIQSYINYKGYYYDKKEEKFYESEILYYRIKSAKQMNDDLTPIQKYALDINRKMKRKKDK